MKISVIIPVKNRASLLPATLDNILGQTLHPYEIIVVDDASTDDIASVKAQYKDKVTFINSHGKGPGAARNAGLKIMTGDTVQFFDSDDLMTKNKLEVQSNTLTAKQADFVYGPNVKAVDNNGKWEQTDVIMQYYPVPAGPFADLVLQGWCAITQSALFTKALIDEVGFWREDLMTHEDYEYWFRIGKTAKSFAHENESCVIYRQHQNQVTDLGVPNQARWMEGIMAMKYIADGLDYRASINSLMLFRGRSAASKTGYLKRFGFDDGAETELLDKLLIPYFKIKTKLGNRATGTAWQPMHGPNASKKVFADYMKLL